MPDYTRGDDPVYNGFREGWKCPCDAKEEDIELNEIVEGIDRDRLRELVEADRDGRCVVLPCRVGDTVWFIATSVQVSDGETRREILERTITQLRGNMLNPVWFIADDRDFHPTEIGKTVFLTRAEAEAALQDDKRLGVKR